jgi:hypothetical protein
MNKAASVIVLVWVCSQAAAAAQEQVTFGSDLLLYGDNTEFHNPFRKGETILGGALRVAADIDVTPRLRVTLGATGNERFGSERAFQLVRPVISVDVRGRRSSFLFGAFPQPSAPSVGPDREGPHGLIAPLQRETLSFDRPYEAGLQWTFAGERLRHAIWLEWQRINTAAHRERFDSGLNGALAVNRAVSLPLQIHVVHEGGQLFASGPVHDSWGAASGADVHGETKSGYRLSIELMALVSKYVQDRSRPDLTRDGVAFFGRAAAERRGWRAHVIMWRGRNFIKDEGDPNYLSVFHDGNRYRGTRDYAEAGLTRRFRLAPDAFIEASGRFHRIERFYEYSYRVVSVVSLRWPLK